MRTWTVALLTALVLAVPLPTWAECAWVLWQETVINKASRENISRTGGWDRQSAHPTYSECVQAARQLALNARSDVAVTFAFGAPAS